MLYLKESILNHFLILDCSKLIHQEMSMIHNDWIYDKSFIRPWIRAWGQRFIEISRNLQNWFIGKLDFLTWFFKWIVEFVFVDLIRDPLTTLSVANILGSLLDFLEIKSRSIGLYFQKTR